MTLIGTSDDAPAAPSPGSCWQWSAEPALVLQELTSCPEGLRQAEVEVRLKTVGPKEIAREKRQSPLIPLLYYVENSLVILLRALGVLSFITGDLRAMAVIFVMVALGLALRFYAEMRAGHAAEKLQAMVSNTATVVRGGGGSRDSAQAVGAWRHSPPGRGGAGRGAAAPCQGPVPETGDAHPEVLPVERKGGPAPPNMDNPLDLPNTCFFGSNVESGSATAVVIHTGDRTCFGSLAASIVGFVQLPPLYWLLLALILQCYVVLTQLVKTWFYRRFGE